MKDSKSKAFTKGYGATPAKPKSQFKAQAAPTCPSIASFDGVYAWLRVAPGLQRKYHVYVAHAIMCGHMHA